MLRGAFDLDRQQIWNRSLSGSATYPVDSFTKPGVTIAGREGDVTGWEREMGDRNDGSVDSARSQFCPRWLELLVKKSGTRVRTESWITGHH